MNNRIYTILIALSVLVGCSTDEDIISVEQFTNELSEAERINQWIYSQMNHYYLWREDMPDSIECDFNLTPKEFYESLLSSKDRFSYMDFNSSSSLSQNKDADFGFFYQKYKAKNEEELLYVLLVTSEEVQKAGIRRGDLLKKHIDKSNMFTFKKVSLSENGSIQEHEILSYLSSVSRAAKNKTVYKDSIYRFSEHKIGYMCYLQYDSPADFHETINRFYNEGISDLILDLRYNPGGLVSTCEKLCNIVVDASGYNNIFQQCSYNNIVSAENLEKYGNERTFTYFNPPNAYSGAILGLKYPYLQLPRIYVLTSQHTASASEATINSLKPYMDVVVIGEQTTGKGVGMFTLSSPEYKYALVPITFRYYNALGETVPDEGLVPDYYVPDGYSTLKREIGDIEEPLLRQALTLICPNIFDYMPMGRASHIEQENNYLTPVGEPSYITEFKQKQYLYENN